MCIRDRPKGGEILGSILEKIEQALKDMLIGWIESNLTNMFTDVNEKVGTIAAEVGQTPSGWNGGVYPVSYTHLDVYKRQPITPAAEPGRIRRKARSAI